MQAFGVNLEGKILDLSSNVIGIGITCNVAVEELYQEILLVKRVSSIYKSVCFAWESR